MNKLDPAIPEPAEPSPSWQKRFFASPIAEYTTQNKGIVIGALSAILILCTLLCIYLSKHQESSITQTLKAQHLVETLQNSDTPAINKTEPLQKLEEIVSAQPSIAAGFCGAVAQEELIQNIEPPHVYCFEKASSELLKNNLSIQSQIDTISLLYAEGKKEQALTELDLILQSIKKTDFPCQTPKALAYLLLQKATILKELHRETTTTVHELEQILEQYPEANAGFEYICAGNVKEVLSFLKGMQSK